MMIGVERRQQLVELVEQRMTASVANLSRHSGVSAATTRRDLAGLSQRAMIEWAYGGAAPGAGGHRDPGAAAATSCHRVGAQPRALGERCPARTERRTFP